MTKTWRFSQSNDLCAKRSALVVTMHAKNMRGIILVGVLVLATSCYAKSTVLRKPRQVYNGGTQGNGANSNNAGGNLDDLIDRTFGNPPNTGGGNVQGPLAAGENSPATDVGAPAPTEVNAAGPEVAPAPTTANAVGPEVAPAPAGNTPAVDDEDCDCEDEDNGPIPTQGENPPQPSTNLSEQPQVTSPPTENAPEGSPSNLLVVIDFPPESGNERLEFSTDKGNDVVVMVEYPPSSGENNTVAGQGEGRDLFVDIKYPTESGTDSVTTVRFSPESGREPLTIRGDAPSRNDPIIFIQFPQGTGLPPLLIGNVPGNEEDNQCVPRPLSVAAVPAYDPGLYKVDGCRVKYDNRKPSYSLYNSVLLFLDRIWQVPYNLLTSAINTVHRVLGINP